MLAIIEVTAKPMTLEQFRALQKILFADGWVISPTGINTWLNLKCSSCGKDGVTVTLHRDTAESFTHEGKTYYRTEERTFDICLHCWQVSEAIFEERETETE